MKKKRTVGVGTSASKYRSRQGKCSATEDCPAPIWARRLCSKHYRRFRQHGDPLAGEPERRFLPRAATATERFQAKVNKDGPLPSHRPDLGPCWMWTATKNPKGYGQFKVSDDERYRAHQFAYILARGSIPPGLEVDHLCHNRACVNPHHLEAVTHRVNVQRRKPQGVAPG